MHILQVDSFSADWLKSQYGVREIQSEQEIHATLGSPKGRQKVAKNSRCNGYAIKLCLIPPRNEAKPAASEAP